MTPSAQISEPTVPDNSIETMRETLAKQAASIPDEARIAVAAQVFKAVVDHAQEGGTFRYLIYDRLGFPPDAYLPLYDAGGMQISDRFVMTDNEEPAPEVLQVLERLANAAPMTAHPTLKRADGTPVPWPTAERSELFSALGFMQELLDSHHALRESNRRLSQQCEEQARLLEQHTANLPRKG